ncbi:MAG: hypothetical protein NUV80_06850 [Candidatus Berkelbacteria bacterium]|nr:hypothetical protein [Candidatus Berkelbacteria bacterium]MCR4308249.1 hypothetical protein [Candidatus Berkelbacteria bacterium]
MSHTLLSKQLSLLGLEERQADVYLAALTSGGGSVLELARAGSIERTGIYYHIDELVRLGLLLKGTRGKKTIYLPADPHRLEGLLKEKQSTLAKALPELEVLYSKNVEKSQATYYEGEEEILKLYERLEGVMSKMSKNETVYVFSKTFDAVEALPDFFQSYFERRDRMAVSSLTILPYSERPLRRDLASSDALTQAKYSFHSKNRKYIDDSYMPEGVGTVIVASNLVVMIDFKTLFGSITESKNLSTTWRMFFTFLWDHLPQPKK